MRRVTTIIEQEFPEGNAFNILRDALAGDSFNFFSSFTSPQIMALRRLMHNTAYLYVLCFVGVGCAKVLCSLR